MPKEKNWFEAGLEVRQAVHGKAFVEQAFDSARDDHARAFQEVVTAYAWGAVWARGGLPRKTRSLLTLVMLTALNREHELRNHLRGALRNECSPAEIYEALLHSSVYCGIPAAADSLRIAREEIEGFVK